MGAVWIHLDWVWMGVVGEVALGFDGRGWKNEGWGGVWLLLGGTFFFKVI